MVMSLILLVTVTTTANTAFQCIQLTEMSIMEFYLVRSCSRSTMKVVATANLTTPAQCALFTLQKRGLAFNFSPPGILKSGETCLVCECAEFHSLTALKKDWRFDYYSLYGYPLPSSNYTCVPKLGLFELNREPMDFLQAMRSCRSKNSELAHVVSDIRTSYLSGLVKQLGQYGIVTKAYVSLHDILHEGKFMTTRGEPLLCYDYRAWGPSEPRDRFDDEDCVVVDERKQWRVSRCSEKLPYLCELWPGGDNPNDVTTGLVHCSRLENAERRENCIRRERNTHEINKFKRCWKGVTFNKNPKEVKMLPPLFEWKFPRKTNMWRPKNSISKRPQSAHPDNATESKILII